MWGSLLKATPEESGDTHIYLDLITLLCSLFLVPICTWSRLLVFMDKRPPFQREREILPLPSNDLVQNIGYPLRAEYDGNISKLNRSSKGKRTSCKTIWL